MLRYYTAASKMYSIGGLAWKYKAYASLGALSSAVCYYRSSKIILAERPSQATSIFYKLQCLRLLRRCNSPKTTESLQNVPEMAQSRLLSYPGYTINDNDCSALCHCDCNHAVQAECKRLLMQLSVNMRTSPPIMATCASHALSLTTPPSRCQGRWHAAHEREVECHELQTDSNQKIQQMECLQSYHSTSSPLSNHSVTISQFITLVMPAEDSAILGDMISIVDSPPRTLLLAMSCKACTASLAELGGTHQQSAALHS